MLSLYIDYKKDVDYSYFKMLKSYFLELRKYGR